VRRFYCRNAKCARRTFAERLPGLVAPYARRTYRLATAQAQVGVALGGEAGSRLLQHLAMPVSPDTVLRLVHRLPLPAPDPPRVVGVDDWAIRKRCSYGTVVVDLERHRVLDLLPDRTAETLAEWLRDHPGIEAVARDRSTEYARGITLGAPKAIQTADRWHLLANMRQAVERWLHGAQARLRRLPMPPDGDKPAVPARRDRAFPRSAPNGPPAPRAAPGGRLTTPRSGVGTWQARRCSGSRMQRGWHLGPCASMPVPRPSRHGLHTALASASSIPTCPTCNGVWAKAARTGLPCGANCAGKAFQAAPGRSTDG
jgi:hypothetical protein